MGGPGWVDVDLFAGPGGWDMGLRLLGQPSPAGVEIDPAACATGRAAGFDRFDDRDPARPGTADVAAVDPAAVAGGRAVRLLIGSPPCGPFSKAGLRGGIRDLARVLDHLSRLQTAYDWFDPGADGWEDGRSPLVLQPARWILALRPELVALEQVPDVLPVWDALADLLESLGYSVAVGVVSSERYGVPQTRTRTILAARADGAPVRLPAPTHAAYVAPRRRREATDPMFGDLQPVRIVRQEDRGLLPWVSMADALGMAGNAADRPGRTICGDRSPRWMYEQGAGSYGTGWTLRTEQKRGSDRANGTTRNTDEPAPTVLCSRTTNLSWALRNGTQDNACTRTLDEPAGTVFFSQRGNAVDWVADRPATTVQGDPRVAGPGHRDREGGERQFDGEEVVRITIEQAGILQSFPADYPWQGTKTAQFRQVGDAVPPLLAAAILAELLEVPR